MKQFFGHKDIYFSELLTWYDRTMENSVAYVQACVQACVAASNSLASVVILFSFFCFRLELVQVVSADSVWLFLPEFTDQSEGKQVDERTEADVTFTLILKGEGWVFCESLMGLRAL